MGSITSSTGAEPGAGGSRSSAVPSTWKRFTVKDIVLGTPLASLKAQGFTCGPDKGNSMPHCVKFLDDRCKDRKITVRAISMNTDPPEGKGCVYDSGPGSTLLDHEKTKLPMSNIAVKGTDTENSRAYEITFTYGMNILGDDTKLGTALIEKYGKPELVNAPSQLAWTVDTTQLQAICGTSTADWGQYCFLNVSDSKILESERSVQKDIDDRKAKANAADAPAL
ncbi:MAG: hypothetical protein H7138_13890 [Myxococcales bacterium]|nr:hypothetical protein [Myxococcales bacterium]